MTATRSQWWCPACGDRVRQSHRCHAPAAGPLVPMPPDFRDRVRAAREAPAGPVAEVETPPLFDPEGDQ